MKNFAFVLCIFLIVSCNGINKNSDDLADFSKIKYSNYKEIDFLKDYVKMSDTAYVKSGNQVTHRITELKKDDKTVILFSKITVDTQDSESYTLLDTLHIKKLNENLMITIGYCNVENYLVEEVIAVVEKTDSDSIKKIEKVWKANSQTNTIEPVKKTSDISCINEK